MQLSSPTLPAPSNCAVLPAGSVTQISHLIGDNDVKFVGTSVNARGFKSQSAIMDAAGVRQLLQLPGVSKALDDNDRKFPGLDHFVRVTLIDALKAWKQGKQPQQPAAAAQSGEIAAAAAASASSADKDAAFSAPQPTATKKRKSSSTSSENPPDKLWEAYEILDRREISGGRVEYLGQPKASDNA